MKRIKLRDVVYEDAEHGYGDVVAPRYGGPSAKYVFLREAKRFLRATGKLLTPEIKTKIKTCPGGFAVSGDASLHGRGEDGRHLYVTLGYVCRDAPSVCWRIGERPCATDGANHWIEDLEATPETVARDIRRAWSGGGAEAR